MARPGRSKYKSADIVPKLALDAWVQGLPAGDLVLVSLLGTKPGSPPKSEFRYYPFSGGLTPDPKKPTLEAWLNALHLSGKVTVIEVPTMDLDPQLAPDKLAAATKAVQENLAAGRTVIVMDSGGWSRTGEVCESMGFSIISKAPFAEKTSGRRTTKPRK